MYIAVYEVPGGKAGHRIQIVKELLSLYKPGCAPDRYDQSWQDQWIGNYHAPTAGPLTTARDPNET